jgi:hypothetical protein
VTDIPATVDQIISAVSRGDLGQDEADELVGWIVRQARGMPGRPSERDKALARLALEYVVEAVPAAGTHSIE